MTWWQSNGLDWSNSTPKKGNNFGCKYSYILAESGISSVLYSSDYKVMTGCLKLIAWSHIMVLWYHIRLKNLEKVLWTPNSVRNFGVIDNLQPKLLLLFGDVLLHSMPMDCHQEKSQKGSKNSDSSIFKFESSCTWNKLWGSSQRRLFEENSYINISFIQLPSHM